jgi:hypothetical protein
VVVLACQWLGYCAVKLTTGLALSRGAMLKKPLCLPLVANNDS